VRVFDVRSRVHHLGSREQATGFMVQGLACTVGVHSSGAGAKGS